MTIEVVDVSVGTLVEYALIPIAFTVETVFDVAVDHGGNRFRLSERAVETAYVKDYDALAESPVQWPARFDASRWALMIARIRGQCAGGAAIAYDASELDMLEGRSDLAVLWDIRVRPESRRRGVGAALLQAAETWALGRDCRQLKVETQNVNVGACRFYERCGFVLRAVHQGAYAECPDEVQLLWYKNLTQQKPPANIALEPTARN